jgi:hypothetical protein
VYLLRKEVGMPKKLYYVHLRAKERELVERYVKQGKKSVTAINRACILLKEEGQGKNLWLPTDGKEAVLCAPFVTTPSD